MEHRKKITLLICLAVAVELVILTDALAVLIANNLVSDVIMRAVVTFPLVYIFWISGIFIIRNYYKKHPAIHFSHDDSLELRHILGGLLLLVITTVLMCISWGGMKIYNELLNSIQFSGLGLGIAHFVAQHIYYAIEVVLITMLVAFAQEVGDALFKPRWIPYGGIMLAILWGLPHILWHGLADGLGSVAFALLYGLAFLIMRKNIRRSFMLIFLMFVL